MTDLLEVEELERLLRDGARPAGRELHDGRRAGRADRPQRHGQDDALQGDRRPARGDGPLVGSVRLDGRRAARPAVVQDRQGRRRLRAAGPAAVHVADRRRAPARSSARRARRTGRPIASTSCSRASPSARTSPARRCRAASRRCSRSAARCSPTRKLLIMDEPSEGLAPTVVETLIQTIKDLAARRAWACWWSSRTSAWRRRSPTRQLVMVAGTIATETTADGAAGRPRGAEALSSASSRCRTLPDAASRVGWEYGAWPRARESACRAPAQPRRGAPPRLRARPALARDDRARDRPEQDDGLEPGHRADRARPAGRARARAARHGRPARPGGRAVGQRGGRARARDQRRLPGGARARPHRRRAPPQPRRARQPPRAGAHGPRPARRSWRRAALEEVQAEGLRPVGATVALPGLVDAARGALLVAPNLGWNERRGRRRAARAPVRPARSRSPPTTRRTWRRSPSCGRGPRAG